MKLRLLKPLPVVLMETTGSGERSLFLFLLQQYKDLSFSFLPSLFWSSFTF